MPTASSSPATLAELEESAEHLETQPFSNCAQASGKRGLHRLTESFAQLQRSCANRQQQGSCAVTRYRVPCSAQAAPPRRDDASPSRASDCGRLRPARSSLHPATHSHAQSIKITACASAISCASSGVHCCRARTRTPRLAPQTALRPTQQATARRHHPRAAYCPQARMRHRAGFEKFIGSKVTLHESTRSTTSPSARQAK